MKTPHDAFLKDQARQSQPEFNPALHGRIVSAIRAEASSRRKQVRFTLRFPVIALALAACVILGITLFLLDRQAPAPRPNPDVPIQAELPTPKAILAMNVEPAGKEVVAALSPDMSAPLASLDGIPAFFQTQLNLLPE